MKTTFKVWHDSDIWPAEEITIVHDVNEDVLDRAFREYCEIYDISLFDQHGFENFSMLNAQLLSEEP